MTDPTRPNKKTLKAIKDSKAGKTKRAIKIKQIIEQTLKEDQELLDRLGSDYDATGVPYWEKYEERLKYMEENGI